MTKQYCIILGIILLALSLGCSTEYRTYKRVGGNHLKLTSGDKELFWFNGIHGNDPKNPMFNDITTEFQKFEPTFVLVEGYANYNIPTDSIAAIKRGENVYVAFLADKEGIPMQTTEPTDSSINNFLLTNYSAEDVLSMYIIRQMVQWKRENGKRDFESDVVLFAKSIVRDLPISNQKISLDYLRELLKTHTGNAELNNTNWKDFDAKNYIYFSDNLINEIYEKVSEFRNIYLIKLIEEKSGMYNKLFVMVGFDHALEIKDDLKKIF